MSDEGQKPTEIERELAYYRKRVDELAGENLRLDYTVSGLRHELKQKRQGFQLLSSLQKSIGSEQEVTSIMKVVVQAINGGLGMDKTILLEPTETENVFLSTYALGTQDSTELKNIEIELPSSIADGSGKMIVSASTEKTAHEKQIAKIFSLPYFVAVGIRAENRALGALITGRIREAKPLYPALDEGDVATLQAIAGLIGSTAEIMHMAGLKETDRLKTQFFANISHEFRTPITLTMGPLESLLRGRYGDVSQDIQKEATNMLRNQRRLLDLINQILDLAKLESGGMQLEVSEVADINEFLKTCLDPFYAFAEKLGLDLRLSLDPACVGQPIFLDLEALEKVVFNLVSNACKFTKQGHVEVVTSIQDNALSIRVSDSGIGIRADQIAHVFDRFKQADGSTSREFAGTGIGLSLVKELVELHKGSIDVSSQYGKGTSFEARFKLGQAHLPPEFLKNHGTNLQSNPSSNTRGNAPARGPLDIREGRASAREISEIDALNNQTLANLKSKAPLILYVDDNHELRLFVRTTLQKEFNVILGVDGKDGLEKALQHPVDLILSDLMMPVMTGSDFLVAARQESKLTGVPFVLLTAKSGLDAKIQELERGADDYLSKPFSEEELFARIKNLLSVRSFQQRLKRELQAARDIQQALLPNLAHPFGRITVEALYHPCEDLSGDFFDVIELSDWVYIYLIDVTSHGTPAAQVTYLIKAMFRELISDSESPPKLAALMRRARERYNSFGLEYMVSLHAFRIHRETGIGEFSSSNAPSAYIIEMPKPKPLQILQAPQFAANSVEDENDFKTLPIHLKKGEPIVCFTDGAYEFSSRDGVEMGERRFLKFVSKFMTEVSNEDGTSWKEQIFETLYNANQSKSFPDDITILKISVD